MFLRFLSQSIRQSPRRKMLTIAAVAMGSAVATAMLGAMLEVGDRVAGELRSMGANLRVVPKSSALPVEIGGLRYRPLGREEFIPENLVPKLKSIFWGLNITGFAPALEASAPLGGGILAPVEGVWFLRNYRAPGGASLATGLRALNRTWKVEGRWVEDAEPDDHARECMVGRALAAKLGVAPGSTLNMFGEPFTVTGVLATGGDEDDRVYLRLEVLQRLTGRAGQVDSIEVGALTKPEDAFARKDPALMNPAEFERWNCTPYVASIAHQIEEALPMTIARPIRRVSDNEGRVLSRIRGLMLLVSLAALAAAGAYRVERDGLDCARAARRDRHHASDRRQHRTGSVSTRGRSDHAGPSRRTDWLAGRVTAGPLGKPQRVWRGRWHARAARAIGGAGGRRRGAGRRGATAAPLACAFTGSDAARGRLVFWRFVVAAVAFRKRRLLLAFAGLAVSATLATVLFSVYSGIERRMRAEFRGYGANLVIAPRGAAASVPLRAVEEAERLGAAAAPFIYTVGKLRGESVVLAGVDFRRAAPLTSYWRVEGASMAGAGECLAGSTAAAHFHLGVGDRADLAAGACVIRGIVSTGGAEDNQLLLPFERVAAEAGVRDAASVVQVRADGARVEQVRAALALALPDDDIRLLYAVAETEANVVLKVRTALFLLSGLILAIAVLCVAGNFSTLVIERGQEIGMLKAIGAGESRIAAIVSRRIAAAGARGRGGWLRSRRGHCVLDRPPDLYRIRRNRGGN